MERRREMMTTLDHIEALQGAMINADVILPGRLARWSMPLWKAIVHEVSKARGIPVEDILGRRKTQEIVACRFECWASIKERLGANYSEIAYWFGVDYSTVINGISRWHSHYTKSRATSACFASCGRWASPESRAADTATWCL